MSLVKAPLLSLGATGTLARKLTFRRSGHQNVALEIPSHPDARSLRQIYHRWTYQDACFWWHSLSAPEQAAYNVLAKGKSKTGFNVALAYYLRTRPDIAAHYHLDTNVGAVSVDSSANAKDGTIFGADLLPGLFDNCFHFDGLDDRIVYPTNSVLNLPVNFSIAVWFTAAFGAGPGNLLEKYEPLEDAGYQLSVDAIGKVAFVGRTGIAAFQAISSDARYDDGSWHVAIIRRLAAQWYLTVDDAFKDATKDAGSMSCTKEFVMGFHRFASISYHHGDLDECVLFNRFISDDHCRAIYQRRPS